MWGLGGGEGGEGGGGGGGGRGEGGDWTGHKGWCQSQQRILQSPAPSTDSGGRWGGWGWGWREWGEGSGDGWGLTPTLKKTKQNIQTNKKKNSWCILFLLHLFVLCSVRLSVHLYILEEKQRSRHFGRLYQEGTTKYPSSPTCLTEICNFVSG